MRGMDSDLGANTFPELVMGVKEGHISSESIEQAAGRILRVKFQLGLFESPYGDPDHAEKVTDNEPHRALARQVARESIILLKNAGGLLPLSRELDSIAVIGPNADSVYNQLGDYTAPQPESKVVTVLQAIRAAVGPKTVDAMQGERRSAAHRNADSTQLWMRCGNPRRSSWFWVDRARATSAQLSPPRRRKSTDRCEWGRHGIGEGFDRAT